MIDEDPERKAIFDLLSAEFGNETAEEIQDVFFSLIQAKKYVKSWRRVAQRTENLDRRQTRFELATAPKSSVMDWIRGVQRRDWAVLTWDNPRTGTRSLFSAPYSTAALFLRDRDYRLIPILTDSKRMTD